MSHTPQNEANRHLDPVTSEPGAHPVGVGAGTACGAIAGAAVGSVGGPVGAVIGAVIGGVTGGLTVREAAEAIDPTAEESYWQQQYAARDYVEKGAAYDDYRSAYRYGWEARVRHADKRYEDVESDLERGWENAKDTSKLTWDEARRATRDAWDRVDPPRS